MSLTKETKARCTVVLELSLPNNFYTETSSLEEVYAQAAQAARERCVHIGPGVSIKTIEVEAIIVRDDSNRARP